MIIKKTARFISLAALFLLPVFPLIVANDFYFPFITGKAFFFRILVEIAFAGWVILAALDAKYRPKLTPLTIAVSLFALVTLVADLLGVSPLRSLWSNFERMEGWMTIIHLWALYMVSTSIFGSGEESRRAWHRFLNVELAVAAVVSIYGLFQLFGWAAIHQGSTRIDASLGNAAYMAVYMLINAGLASYMTLAARAGKIINSAFLKWAYPVLAVLFSFEIFETATRGTILGLAGGIMLASFLYAVLGKNEKKSRRMWAAGAIVLVIALGGALYAAKNTAFVKSHDVLNRLASISIDTQGQARAYVWPMALKGSSQRPILGWGQENFNYIFNANYNPKMWNQEQWFDRAHSVFLDWLTASGIVGLLAYLALYALFLVAVWRSSLTIAEKSVLTGLLAGYAVHNVFVFDNLASYFLFFTVLGFANSLREGKQGGWLSRASVSPEAVEYVIAPAVIVACVATLYFFNIRPIQANARLIDGLVACAGPSADPAPFKSALAVGTYVANQEIREQILSCTTSAVGQQALAPATKEALYELSVQAVTDQIAATRLKDARTYSLAGSFYDSLQQFDKGSALLETAHELSPAKQTITLELSNAYINMGQAAKAVDILASAYQSATENTQVASVYALALVAAGNETKAHEVFGNDSAIFETPGMAQAYAYVKDYAKSVTVLKKLAAASPTDMNLSVQLAQAQYKAGMITASVATLRQMLKDHPEYKDQIEQAIKQVQTPVTQ